MFNFHTLLWAQNICPSHSSKLKVAKEVPKSIQVQLNTIFDTHGVNNLKLKKTHTHKKDKNRERVRVSLNEIAVMDDSQRKEINHQIHATSLNE